MRTLLGVSACVLLCAGIAWAQQPTFHDSLLDNLAGNWVLQGTMAGKQTTQDVEAAWVLAHQYLLIHEVSRERNLQNSPAYEAMVFIGWDQAANGYVCLWLDTFGGMYDTTLGRAQRDGNEIHFVFQYKDSILHTRFIYHPGAGAWEWQMDSEVNGVMKPFARVKLTRK